MNSMIITHFSAVVQFMAHGGDTCFFHAKKVSWRDCGRHSSVLTCTPMDLDKGISVYISMIQKVNPGKRLRH